MPKRRVLPPMPGQIRSRVDNPVSKVASPRITRLADKAKSYRQRSQGELEIAGLYSGNKAFHSDYEQSMHRVNSLSRKSVAFHKASQGLRPRGKNALTGPMAKTPAAMATMHKVEHTPSEPPKPHTPSYPDPISAMVQAKRDRQAKRIKAVKNKRYVTQTIRGASYIRNRQS